MKRHCLTAVIWKEGARYISNCPEVGVASYGRTAKVARKALEEAVGLYLSNAKQLGLQPDLDPSLRSERYTALIRHFSKRAFREDPRSMRSSSSAVRSPAGLIRSPRSSGGTASGTLPLGYLDHIPPNIRVRILRAVETRLALTDALRLPTHPPRRV